ncbi:unnamed protein product [Blepharisma stoltei]|uniref:Kinesin-like protein n=1 Tax=Blepharisma stoltei TaxID=1481888 RepID=A0AAU9K1Z1_9CILI|nr:unnamed protein product [Blepharisma stoltei]
MEESEDVGSGNIKVVCRFRPLNQKEKEISMRVCVDFSSDNKTVIVKSQQENSEPLKFNYDHVFDPESTQGAVYEIAAKPIVEAVMQGFNGTVFAYGQTSSGKTFTMTGPDITNPGLMGIIPRMVSTVFDKILSADEHLEFQIKVAYCEIYMEKIKDLLDPSKSNLKIHEDRTRGIYIADLTERYVADPLEVSDLMKVGSQNREVGYTNMNAGSSRSHSIFILTVSQSNSQDLSAKTGKLYLVDLAGSEKIGKTGAEGKRLEEAKTINKSLTTLGQVISALTDGKSSHIPYRDSKLTRVLQDSLGGNSKTALIITCSPSPYNEEETISTLRFGIRAKAIKNKPKINREYTVGELKLMLAKAKEEIALKDKKIKALERSLKKTGAPIPVESEIEEDEKKDNDETEEIESKSSAYDEVIAELEETRARLSEEVENNMKFKNEFAITQTELVRLQNESRNSQQQIIDLLQQLTEIEEVLKEKEKKYENYDTLKVTNESLLADLNAANFEKLKLEKNLAEKEIEIEQVQTRLKMSGEREISSLRHELEEEKSKNIRLAEEITVYQRRIDEFLHQNGGKLSEHKEELFRRERESWKQEKKSIAREIQSKIERIVNLEIQLDESRAGYKTLESNMSQGEKSLKKKTDTLERNLDQLTLMYQQLVSQKSMLKVDKQINERKIQRLNERCQILEDQSNNLKSKLLQAQQQIKNLQNDKEEIIATPRYSLNVYTPGNSRIRKPIRGGSKKVTHSPERHLFPPEDEEGHEIVHE